jgi:hypothetical protein
MRSGNSLGIIVVGCLGVKCRSFARWNTRTPSPNSDTNARMCQLESKLLAPRYIQETDIEICDELFGCPEESRSRYRADGQVKTKGATGHVVLEQWVVQ